MDQPTQRISRREAVRRGGLVAATAAVGMAALYRGEIAPASAATSTMNHLVSAQLGFGFRLYESLARTTPSGQNLFISPLSIALALAMVYNGARTGTRTALATSMGLGSMSTGDLNAAAAALLAHLRTIDTAIDVSIADSLWLRQGLTVLPAFSQALRRYYAATATNLDFHDPQAPGTINAWVSKQTHGLISSIVTRIPPQMILYLINALYFKGPWAGPFTVGMTTPGPFTLPNGSTRTLPMMRKTAGYAYYKGPAYEAISLPYGSGAMAMYIVLPVASSSLASFQQGLDAAAWATLLANLKQALGTIILPRFSISYSTSLNTALSALGMDIAFDPQRADLTGMVHLTNGRAYIGDVAHKTVLKVDEQGTLAAAVTSIGVATAAMPISQFTMTVNRPFFCAVRDETTGTLLFMGGIANPGD